MSDTVRPYVQAIWIGIAVQIIGRIRDGIWHANNEEFEAASQQLEAHWILWLGVAFTFGVALAAMARLRADERNPGFGMLAEFCAFTARSRPGTSSSTPTTKIPSLRTCCSRSVRSG